ncbi:PFD2 [Auxenochlorella protothecoides x Auxenochlorella symbiontica]
MAAQELKTEQEIVNKFQQLLEERNALSTAAIERRSEVAEHELVVKTLEPLDASRKCFKLLGDILVERTVGEVLPTVNENKNNLLSLVRTYEQQLEAKQAEVLAFQDKYKIRVKGEGENQEAPKAQAPGSGKQGVLVSNS